MIIKESLIIDQYITSTLTPYNTYNGRKFSDYDLLIFICKAGRFDIRRTNVEHSWFGEKYIDEAITHGANNANISNVVFNYDSDTSIKMRTGGSNGISLVDIVGIKIGKRN